jgi:diguanylate cyclase (GGDEF)-like protein
MVVKNKHYLPYKGELDAKQVLYTPKVTLPTMRSALVLPLVVREDAIGTLAVVAERAHAFGDGVRPVLQLLSNQLAIALSNARAVKRLEEMATTDGLTGCLNKRAFLEELEAKIRSAHRFHKKLSLIVTDIDHFKSVNDTYGHATGDVVIKELGAILMRVKRETDRVARFGGEEFCVLCEETDTEGAVQLAERVREELGRTVFQTELGKLRVTASLGVATFPQDAPSSQGLFEITDKALYAAKHSGRDCVRTAADV